MAAQSEIKTTIIAETQNYLIYTAGEPDGETTYNIELGTITVHLFKEEWEEFRRLMQALPDSV